MRHILVDTVGLLLHAVVHPADIRDRDGGKLVLATMFGLHPFLRKLFADGGYHGPKFKVAQKKILLLLVTEIVKRSDQAKGFEVIPRRWVVERTFAWLGRCRRLAKDFENLTRNALAFIRLASIRLMVRNSVQAPKLSGPTLSQPRLCLHSAAVVTNDVLRNRFCHHRIGPDYGARRDCKRFPISKYPAAPTNPNVVFD